MSSWIRCAVLWATEVVIVRMLPRSNPRPRPASSYGKSRVNRPINSTAPAHLPVGSIDNRVNMLRRNIAQDHVEMSHAAIVPDPTRNVRLPPARREISSLQQNNYLSSPKHKRAEHCPAE